MTTFFVDGHVHFHSVYDSDRFFDRAVAVARAPGATACLWFAENWGDQAFRGFRDGALTPSRYRIERTSESESLVARGETGEDVILIAGRQIITTENLEVLVVGLDPDDELGEVPPRTEAADVLLRRGLSKGALVGLPWGFGKWVGRRGRIVESLAAREEFRREPRFFFGDILARCWPWPTPRVFGSGPPLLPGTDVLPLPGFEDRVLGYGFRVDADHDAARPWESLRNAVVARSRLRIVGQPDSLFTTAVNQTRYRLRKKENA